MFYTRAINYLEGLNIDAKKADDHKTGWRQLKMVFKGKDWLPLQILIDNSNISPESQKMPQQVLNTIETTIKSEDHFWHFWDELLLDVHQLPDEDIHALNIHITTLIN